jgi:hypothetical protein
MYMLISFTPAQPRSRMLGSHLRKHGLKKNGVALSDGRTGDPKCYPIMGLTWGPNGIQIGPQWSPI